MRVYHFLAVIINVRLVSSNRIMFTLGLDRGWHWPEGRPNVTCTFPSSPLPSPPDCACNVSLSHVDVTLHVVCVTPTSCLVSFSLAVCVVFVLSSFEMFQTLILSVHSNLFACLSGCLLLSHTHTHTPEAMTTTKTLSEKLLGHLHFGGIPTPPLF